MKTASIIEDEEIMRELLSTSFTATFPEIERLGMAGNEKKGMEQYIEMAPDLVIIDIQLPEINGLEILSCLEERFPRNQNPGFTGQTPPRTIEITIHCNANGSINKISNLEELEKAIRATQNDKQFFSPEAYKEVLQIRAEEPKQTSAPEPRQLNYITNSGHNLNRRLSLKP
ncbi:MAG: response regulator [Verrucomicrobiota bacterium]